HTRPRTAWIELASCPDLIDYSQRGAVSCARYRNRHPATPDQALPEHPTVTVAQPDARTISDLPAPQTRAHVVWMFAQEQSDTHADTDPTASAHRHLPDCISSTCPAFLAVQVSVHPARLSKYGA